MTDDHVIVRRAGRLGHLQLNRPRAINALTHEMVGLIDQALDAWTDDADVTTVLLTGAGDRGFCAGGDIVALYEDARSGGSAGERFWRDEYRLDTRLAELDRPVVAVMDGIVLGGGIGLSAHCSHRVVTERSSIGMPEVGIGFLPDVGGTHLLARAPGELGTHLALTAGSVEAGDALALGLADAYVPSERVPDLVAALERDDADAALARYAEQPPPAPLLEERDWIDEAYAGDDLATIVARLDDRHPDTATRIRRGSPTSCAVALRALRAAAGLSLRETFEQDLRLAVRLQHRPDFVEGVRAQVIDKDRAPRWNPATAAEVDPALVDACFATLDRPLFEGETS